MLVHSESLGKARMRDLNQDYTGGKGVDPARTLGITTAVLTMNGPLEREVSFQHKTVSTIKVSHLKNGQINPFTLESVVWNFYVSTR